MNEELLTLQDIIGTLRRHMVLIGVVVAVCTGIAFVMSTVLPKKYKATALLNLQSTYFDSVVGGRESGEMQAQKMALLRLALSDDFIDKEGEKFKVFKGERGTPKRAGERTSLRKNIDYFASTATTFLISGIGGSAEMAFDMTTDVLNQIVTVLVNERQKSILSYRESLRKQVESLGIAMSATSLPSAGAQPQVLREELSTLQAEAAALQAQYTADHPKVVAIRQKIESIRQMLDHATTQAQAAPSGRGSVVINPNAKGGRSEFAEELLKKINYIDISLELENNRQDLPYLEILERPVLPNTFIFPKTGSFLIGGALLGFLLSGLSLGFLELKRATVMTPLAAAQQLGVPLLGLLPLMTHAEPVIVTARASSEEEGEPAGSASPG